MGLDWGGLSEIGVGLGARCVRVPLWGSVSSPGHRATGLGSWGNLECGMDEDEWMRMFCFALGGVIG